MSDGVIMVCLVGMIWVVWQEHDSGVLSAHIMMKSTRRYEHMDLVWTGLTWIGSEHNGVGIFCLARPDLFCVALERKDDMATD